MKVKRKTTTKNTHTNAYNKFVANIEEKINKIDQNEPTQASR